LWFDRIKQYIKNGQLLSRSKINGGICGEILRKILKLMCLRGNAFIQSNEGMIHLCKATIVTLIQMVDFFHTSVDLFIGHSEAQAESEGVPVFKLNTDEIRLVNQYRQLSLKEKDSIHLVMENYCK
jgi:hypothetical protein